MGWRDRFGFGSGSTGEARPKPKPYTSEGRSGTAVLGGYVVYQEKESTLAGAERWKTAADILANISIVAAGVRNYLNLMAKAQWSVEPAEDADGNPLPGADEAADFLLSCMHDMETGWPRVVRRAALYKYHGFSLGEWVAKRRDDGMIGIKDIRPRPCHTIERWDRDPTDVILGVEQLTPETNEPLYIPRGKLLYMVDDTLTDSPEGMGWFRHLAEPAQRVRDYLKLERIGFQRDLSGIPVGRAPLTRINEMIKNGEITEEDGAALIQGAKDFVRLKVKDQNTGMLLDSQPYESDSAEGKQVASVLHWGIDLLTGKAESIEALGTAINRLNQDMALVIGAENLLVGRDGAGSLALSKDKSAQLYLSVNSSLGDVAEFVARDFVGPIWALNGLPDELQPTLKTEDVAFRDIEAVTAALRDMATAGAILDPDDPAIDDIRDMLGISRTVPTAGIDPLFDDVTDDGDDLATGATGEVDDPADNPGDENVNADQR